MLVNLLRLILEFESLIAYDVTESKQSFSSAIVVIMIALRFYKYHCTKMHIFPWVLTTTCDVRF